MSAIRRPRLRTMPPPPGASVTVAHARSARALGKPAVQPLLHLFLAAVAQVHLLVRVVLAQQGWQVEGEEQRVVVKEDKPLDGAGAELADVVDQLNKAVPRVAARHVEQVVDVWELCSVRGMFGAGLEGDGDLDGAAVEAVQQGQALQGDRVEARVQGVRAAEHVDGYRDAPSVWRGV